MQFDGVIDLESEETWPDELRSLLQKHTPLLVAFERERARIDRLCERNVRARIQPPVNRYARARAAVLEQVETILSGKNLLGFHCTRLTEDEICTIRSEGLQPLSPELVEGRVQNRVISGDITKEFATKLLSRHQAGDENRRGKTWFVFSKSLLRDESGMWRLFRSWGGEALYNGREEDPVSRTVLRRIGSPCIVVSSVRIDDRLGPVCQVGERFVARWLQKRRVQTNCSPEMEGYVNARLGSDRVLMVLPHLHPDIAKLTRYRKWRQSIT
jgi:hypothetical protein